MSRDYSPADRVAADPNAIAAAAGSSGMQVFSIDGRRETFLMGESWALQTSLSEANRYTKGHQLGLIVSRDDQHCVSILDADELTALQIKRTSPPLSALAVIAQQCTNAIVYHAINRDWVWIAASRDGIPLPSVNRIVPTAAAPESFSEASSFVPNSVLIGTPDEASATVGEIMGRLTAKDVKLATYQKPKSPVAVLVKLGIFGVGVAACTLVYHQVQAARELADRTRAAAMARLNESQRIEREIENYEASAREQVLKARKHYESVPPANDQFTAWKGTLAGVPSLTAGWRLDSAICSPEDCQLVWKPLPGVDLRGPALGTSDAVVSTADDKIVTSRAVDKVAKVPRPREERLAIVSRFNVGGSAANIQLQMPPTLQPVMVPLPPKPQLSPEQLARLNAITPVRVAQKIDFTLTTPFHIAPLALDWVGPASGVLRMELGPLTSPTGAPLVPVAKFTGEYVLPAQQQ